MRLIDADAFLKSEIERCGCVPLIGSCTSDNEIFKFILERQPTIEAKEVVRGEWIVGDVEPGYFTPGGNRPWVCSECGEVVSWYLDKPKENFCSNCGADMRKKV